MTADHFQTLGLGPGRHDPRAVALRFHALRSEALRLLARPETVRQGEARLDALHLAYNALRDGGAADADRADHLAQLRALIAASLEDGLLRYSRRQRILDAGRAAGLSDFETQLVIAQVQFGDCDSPGLFAPSASSARRPVVWPFVTAAAMLGLAVLLAEVWWFG